MIAVWAQFVIGKSRLEKPSCHQNSCPMNPFMPLESQSMDPLPLPSRLGDAVCDMSMDSFWHVTHGQLGNEPDKDGL